MTKLQKTVEEVSAQRLMLKDYETKLMAMLKGIREESLERLKRQDERIRAVLKLLRGHIEEFDQNGRLHMPQYMAGEELNPMPSDIRLAKEVLRILDNDSPRHDSDRGTVAGSK